MMGRRKGSKNKATLLREAEERSQERSLLQTEKDRVLRENPEADTSEIDGQLRVLDAADAAAGLDAETDDTAETGETAEKTGATPALPNVSLDKDAVDALLSETLTEEERARRATIDETEGDGTNNAPLVSDQGVVPVNPTGDAAELKTAEEGRKKRSKAELKTTPASAAPIDRAAMLVKREKFAAKFGPTLDKGFDKIAGWLKSPIHTSMIQTGVLFPNPITKQPTPRGIPFDIDFATMDARDTLLVNGEKVYATPGMAVVFNLAGQGEPTLKKLGEIVEKHEETIRCVAAAAIVIGWGYACHQSAKLYAAHLAEMTARAAQTPNAVQAPAAQAPTAQAPAPVVETEGK